MPRILFLIPALLLVALVLPAVAEGQLPAWGGDVNAYTAARYGEFLSWYKLAILAGSWLLWVILADRANRDLLRFGEDLGMAPEFWNAIVVGLMVAGLAAVLFIPVFWIGLPIYLVAAFLPLFLYRTIRKSRIRGSAQLAFLIEGKSEVDPEARKKKKDAGELADASRIQLIPPGDVTERQRLLILARQSPAFDQARNLVGNGITSRVDLMQLDYTRENVTGRMQIDGVWNPIPPMERELGDQVLVALKNLAGLDPADRRRKQHGRFDMKWEEAKLTGTVDVLTQGVPTGEQVQIRFQRAAGKPRNMSELKLKPEGVDKARRLLDKPGIVIVSAPAQGGLTTLWKAALLTSDRITRDVVGILLESERESDIENIQQKKLKPGDQPLEVLRKIALTQPNAFVVPDLIEPAFADAMCRHALDEQRTIITRKKAATSAEALLATASSFGDRNLFARALHGIICQRMVRQLCPSCKVEMPVKPELIRKLGGDPAQQKTLFRHYVLPPVEQRVDERGRPVEMQPCSNCSGTGFVERTAALEVIEVDDSIRKVLLAGGDADALEKAFRAAGNRLLLDEAFTLVLAGKTSLDEVRRVFRLGTG